MRTKLVVLLATVALAQTDRGIINGTVADSSGAGVPDARVSATNTNTNVGFATQTTSTGDFTIPQLPVGVYQLRVEKQGFKAAVRSDITVSAGGTVTVNATMEVGAVTESIVVAAT
ncbi:MAG: carboxypeptidase-like regulatory domain-containing protein, partial [Bryobacteraceae bacterium]